jgi:RNA polymerase sigma-70 factor (ECF subfamily)
MLTKIFGTENMETAEDVVQQTFIDAMRVWGLKGIPDNPSAWLFRVAKNKTIDYIRKNKHSLNYDFNEADRVLLNSEYTLVSTIDNLLKEELIKDDMLRMMFACCHPEISTENQITLILKTLCGFSTAEIAKAFITSEETVSKRLYRTKEVFRNSKIELSIPSVHELKQRTSAILNSIYLIFNEGYHSAQSDQLIRLDLIEEAFLLCKLLTESEHTQVPEAYALMALMCFHSARNASRIDAEGAIILLPNQDRTKWDNDLIDLGNQCMNQAAFGGEISTYHIEAAIAYEHCSSPSFEQTNWTRILELYEWLSNITTSPIIELNKTVAWMQVHGAESALKYISNIDDIKRLETYYLYHCLLAEIYAKLNNKSKAAVYLNKAMTLTKSASEHKIIADKIALL